MPDWFTKARRSLANRSGTVEPQAFGRVCTCGHALGGLRSQEACFEDCPKCGRSWFVLPNDVYPRPKPPAKRGDGRPTGAPDPAARPASGGRGNARPNTPGDRSEPPAEESRTEESRAEEPRTGPAAWSIAADPAVPKRTVVSRRVRRFARPGRLMLAGIAATVIVTAIWLTARARRDAAAATVVRVVPLAEAAVDRKDFPEAARLYDEATAALRVVGRTDDEAETIRQRARELGALGALASDTPYDLAAQAERLAVDPAEWTDRFAASFAGRWVILDATALPPEPSMRPVGAESDRTPAEGENRPEDDRADAPPAEIVVPLDLPLSAGRRGVRFELPESSIPRESSPDAATGRRVIVAAKYGEWSLREERGSPGTWVVGFRPGEVFLWASPDLLAAAGLEVDDATRALLDRQANLIGVDGIERLSPAGGPAATGPKP